MRRAALFVLASLALLAAAAHADESALERIRSRGAITIGYIEDGRPFSFRGGRGEPQGYMVDLCREIALGVRAQLELATLETRWVALTVQDRLEAVRSGRVDLECSTTTWTLSRQAAVDFSLITFVDGGSILAKAGASLGRLIDFDGKRVAVIGGTTTEATLRATLAARSLKTRLVIVKTRGEGLKLLDEGAVEGFASDRTTLIALVTSREPDGRYTLLDEDFSVEPYVLALPRGDHGFRLAVNRVLARVYRSGEISAIYNRWLGGLGPPSLLLSATYFVQSLAE